MPSLMNFLQSKLISKGVKCRVFVIVIQVMQECQMLVELSKDINKLSYSVVFIKRHFWKYISLR